MNSLEIIVGWKNIAKVLGVHERTVRRWHCEVCKIPVAKIRTSNQGRVYIDYDRLVEWFNSFIKKTNLARKKSNMS